MNVNVRVNGLTRVGMVLIEPERGDCQEIDEIAKRRHVNSERPSFLDTMTERLVQGL